ncbi:conserved hypothetical protein [Candidatus Desulfosporosinus infrequens]|uniref:Virulence-related protein n=1 Tax=Candidatus Desulfosporosinus infrequens TaxID=2043169 RepID=A0A2U3LLN4_9FIRM|nr:conserved hypothetical protein [Candidatus Desulfosporosinus infrequens]
MKNNSFIYSFKASGVERKQIASVIAEALSAEVKYQGPPTFAYRTAGWTIERSGVVTSPEIGDNEILRTVLGALKTVETNAEGNGTVILSLQGSNGNALRNIANLIWYKQKLIQKALGRESDIVPEGLIDAINSVPIDTLEEFAEVVNTAIDVGKIEGNSELEFDTVDKTLSFSFSNASLDANEVFAFITLCQLINEQGKKQRFSSTKQREVVNDKYSFRCFLLKLGFIGDAYKTERKILLARLTGDGAYRTGEARKAAEEKRKVLQATTNENLELETEDVERAINDRY